jgi:tripartite-type tricarboxylate transporter receptor subunit TctC
MRSVGRGLWPRPALPAEVVARLNEEVGKALSQDEVIARLAAEGAEPMPSTLEEFRTFLATEIAKWGKVVRDARVQVNS